MLAINGNISNKNILATSIYTTNATNGTAKTLLITDNIEIPSKLYTIIGSVIIFAAIVTDAAENFILLFIIG